MSDKDIDAKLDSDSVQEKPEDETPIVPIVNTGTSTLELTRGLLMEVTEDSEEESGLDIIPVVDTGDTVCEEEPGETDD